MFALQSSGIKKRCESNTEKSQILGNIEDINLKAFNENLKKVLEVTNEMFQVAEQGDEDRNDDSCGVLYGVVRDSAYKIKKMAEEEILKHKDKNKWE